MELPKETPSGNLHQQMMWDLYKLQNEESRVKGDRVEIIFEAWKQLRGKCQRYWTDDIDNDKLFDAHEYLKAAISRCRSMVMGGGNDVKTIAPCHVEIMKAFEECKNLSSFANKKSSSTSSSDATPE
eukprot:CAMPEP_0194776028 /NCGR_PEP_ID=MMETSP0323_2-20130528/62002_1 /TAXON_ID=2866 ORGANISM="Crypthecodinium cohnii, Strain Seligo" /NCGR_SAMPLE_ID=MMETSP0323_2 /ASSEMBLY_ACC=CAM_ASM_000346 /LENGTH=126 /DNA_ID=CAMNT_0039712251 /DNA_START=23 /DNA_END=403 /DNA_ORIENTATION=-